MLITCQKRQNGIQGKLWWCVEKVIRFMLKNKTKSKLQLPQGLGVPLLLPPPNMTFTSLF